MKDMRASPGLHQALVLHSHLALRADKIMQEEGWGRSRRRTAMLWVAMPDLGVDQIWGGLTRTNPPTGDAVSAKRCAVQYLMVALSNPVDDSLRAVLVDVFPAKAALDSCMALSMAL